MNNFFIYSGWLYYLIGKRSLSGNADILNYNFADWVFICKDLYDQHLAAPLWVYQEGIDVGYSLLIEYNVLLIYTNLLILN